MNQHLWSWKRAEPSSTPFNNQVKLRRAIIKRRLDLFLAFLAARRAAVQEAGDIAAFFLFNDEERIIFFRIGGFGILAQIDIFDPGGFVIILAVFLDILKADELDIGVLAFLDLFLLADLRNRRRCCTRVIALRGQDRRRNEADAALRADNGIL